MTRYLYGSDIVLTAPSAPAVILAPGAPFTLWSDAAGGVKYTDCTAPDGVTALTTDQSGAFVADGSGQRPRLRGPDGVVVMWCDFGSGERFPMYAADLLHDVLAAAIDWLANGINTSPGPGGGGLPTNATLEDIPNGATRLAMTLAERTKLAGVATGATALSIGPLASNAKAGNYAPTAADVGAVKAVGGNWIFWGGRTTTQGPPTVAEGAVPGVTYAFLDVV